MLAMYPEQLRALREQNPGLQYDFRGNVIGATPPDSVQMAADAIYQLPGMQPNAWDFGPTRNDYLNSKDFVGPMPQQWWDPSGDLMQQGQDWLGGFMQGRDLRQYPQNPYAPRRMSGSPMQASGGLPGIGAGSDGLAAVLRQTDQLPIMQQARQAAQQAVPPMGAPYPFDHDDGSGEFVPSGSAARPYGSNADELWPRIQADPGYNPQSSPRGWN